MTVVMLQLVLHVSCESGCETVRLVACSCGSCNREDLGVGVGRGSCSCGTRRVITSHCSRCGNTLYIYKVDLP